MRILQLREADELRDDETAVVVDVLRASTTIAVAFRQGAHRVTPVGTPAQARATAEDLEDAVLVGERLRGALEGFVDNSPATLAGMDLSGKHVVLTTTNGTRALLAAKPAGQVVVGSMVNATRVVEALAGEPVALLASGWEGAPADDDDACCEYLAALLRSEEPDAHAYRARLEQSTSAVKLREAGKGGDVDLCLSIDSAPVLPRLDGRTLVVD